MTITKEKKTLAFAGLVVGLASVFLVIWGNPKNMGFCIACFIRDIAGSLHLHEASAVQYLRPEIPSLVLGAFIASLLGKEFSPRGGSSPVLRFLLGFVMVVCALVFLGCPLRMVLRLAGGDLNALVGLFGFVAGVALGCLFLNRGFSLGRSHAESRLEGLAFPLVQVFLLVIALCFSSLLLFSTKGPGSMHAPILLSILAGLAVGAVSQKSRMCMAGGVRDVILLGDSTLLVAPIVIFVVVLVGNLLTGSFRLSFAGQPVAHTSWLWNFLSMAGVGFSAVLLGGCPLRQLVLAGEGNGDSAMSVLGMLLGGAFAHNFSLASSAEGPTMGGKVFTVLSLLFLVIVAFACSVREKEA